jgi:alpha-ketoglutarate-dependent taurine dioxygenase
MRVCGALSALAALLLGCIAILPLTFIIPENLLVQSNSRPHLSAEFDEGLLPYELQQRPTYFLDQELRIDIGPLGFPLIIRPSVSLDYKYNAGLEILDWHRRNEDWVTNVVQAYGGILFRGFPIYDIYEFDDIIAGLHSNSSGTGVYLGTAPRKKIAHTRFVSSASEIIGSATIPVHLELCYTPNPPAKLYFYVDQPNLPPGGQTPLADFRQVWRDLPSQLKDKLTTKGLLYRRRYFNEKLGAPLDPLQHKAWQAMFETSDKAKVDRMAAAEAFDTHWDSKDNLLLTHHAVINRTHAVTKEEYWSTHFNVLHAATATVPSAFSAQLLNDKRPLVPFFMLAALMYVRHTLLGFDYGSDMVFGDDASAIPWDDAMTIRRTISRNTWIFDWNRGDMLILDNHRIAHGRTPYYHGSRKVYVAWQ